MSWQRRSGTDAKYRTPEHRRVRAGYLADMNRYGFVLCTAANCLMSTRHITNPNGRDRDGLHAGHEDNGIEYAGPQHNACNVKDGAIRARAKQLKPQRRWVL